MKILAIDPGLHCGWALGSDGQHVASGTWELAPARQRRFEGGGMRWMRLQRCLDEIGAVDLVAFEEVRRHRGVDAAHVYGGAIAKITEWCELNNVPYQGVPVGTIKKAATGKGNADKDAMVEACKGRGIEPVDDNQADAVALLFLTMEDYDRRAIA